MHWSKSKNRQAIIRKISLKEKGKIIPNNIRNKMSKTWKNKYANGYINNMTNKKQSIEMKKKASKSMKLKYKNKEIINGMKGKKAHNSGIYSMSINDKNKYTDIIRSAEWQKIRKHILKRDNFKCRICDKKGVFIDHIIPWRISKNNSYKNLQVLCHSCSSRKTGLDLSKYPREDLK